MRYDSKADTLEHIARVNSLLISCCQNLQERAKVHDASKLTEPEKSAFDEHTGKLRGLTYGTPEYKQSLAALGPALQHHYAKNSHHPEHFAVNECNICFKVFPKDWAENCNACGNGGFTRRGGIEGMSLFDLMEMVMDWKAAGERHADGSIERSLAINAPRFAISCQLQKVIENTAREMGWIKP
ncbi:MAG: hypothetical protein EB141_16490 [Verrucomicrobia bacterium]|nr:hypothetical protein [Pseudomonadota bacterium]NDB77212.1 hypothetical protein [Verrucomicrobiota bacterium]NDD40196.1 hypothetical protein [Verrucomicrobiota bacterium]NDF00116.1 hypothetical protein [Verrucomicrobiota bacterium]